MQKKERQEHQTHLQNEENRVPRREKPIWETPKLCSGCEKCFGFPERPQLIRIIFFGSKSQENAGDFIVNKTFGTSLKVSVNLQ